MHPNPGQPPHTPHLGGPALLWIGGALTVSVSAVSLGRRRTVRVRAAQADAHTPPTAAGSALPSDYEPSAGYVPPADQTATATSSTPEPDPEWADARSAAEMALLLGHAGEHRVDERTRLVAWVVVSVIIAGTCVSGGALIAAATWLFYTGVGIVVLGMAWGRAVHAMRDQTQIKSNQR